MDSDRSLPWFSAAAAFGTAHAAASLYWALGGDLLVETVGSWAGRWRAEAPIIVGLTLGAIGLGKLILAWAPWLAARGGGPRGGMRRSASLLATVLIAYGLLTTVAANAALTGVLGPVDDVIATRGHAWLWDPLFLAWGVCLGVALWQGRRRPATRVGRPAVESR